MASAAEREILTVDGHEVAVSNPSKGGIALFVLFRLFSSIFGRRRPRGNWLVGLTS